MRIGILTFQRTNNYGGCLQAYALQQVLTGLGADCELIDLVSDPLSLQPTAKAGLAARLLDAVTRTGAAVVKRLSAPGFDRFRKAHFRLSPPVTPQALPALAQAYDLLVSGSDQVWNCNITGNPEVYLQAFAIGEHGRRGSYAASFGFDALPEAWRARYRDALARFDCLSVREPEGARIIRDLTGREAAVSLDPTLLLSRETWLAVAEPLPIPAPFIFVYQLGLSGRLLAFARQLARRTGLRLVFVPFPVGRLLRGRWYPALSPARWIWLVEHARYVVTNSFHGVSFSITFQKQFYVDLSDNLSSLGSRIVNLLRVAGLEHRVIPKDGGETAIADIDYVGVAPRMRAARDESLAYLTGMMQGEAQE